MTKKRKTLSQAEIWDDSALLQTWDEAVEEYKLYHSIQARGERVEDVLKKATTQKALEAAKEPEWQAAYTSNVQAGNDKPELEDGELEEGATDPILAQQNCLDDITKTTTFVDAHHNDGETGRADGASQQGDANLPQTLAAGSSQDQDLKNLMMSWYWAGYYTGHYEGSLRARKEANRHSKESMGEGINGT